jgi:cyclopropane fatty-acyl-phospholipid synthase-like methyltransferase
MNNALKKNVETYYEECNRDYEIVWQLKDSLALHLGFWDNTTLTNRQALWNMNYQVAKNSQIKASDYVLDAGCGVGGTSLFLANNIGCKVEGISISPYQIKKAKENKKELDIKDRTEFSCQSYYQTNFADNTFDVVIAIESALYSEPKNEFLKEAFRVLKPGGRILVSDWFFKNIEDEKVLKNIRSFAKTWAVDNFIEEKEYLNDLKTIGFENHHLVDLSKNVYPSVRILYRSYFPGIFISRISNLFGFRTKAQIENSKSGKYQYLTFKQSAWDYKHLLAFKPLNDAKTYNSINDFIKTELPIEKYIDKERFSDRYPIISKNGFSSRNIFKRIMHYYLENGIATKKP